MKKLLFLLAVILSGTFPPVFADTAAGHLASSLATHTASIAHSTLAMAQDTAITTYIYAKLASHPNLSTTNLDISTTGGKVTLNGIVSDESQAQEIKQLAQNTAGVKQVDASQIMISQQENGLFIKPSPTTPLPAPKAQGPSKIDPALKETHFAKPSIRPLLHPEDPLLTNPEHQLAKTIQTAFKAKKPLKIAVHAKHRHKKHRLAKHEKKKIHPFVKTKKIGDLRHKTLPMIKQRKLAQLGPRKAYQKKIVSKPKKHLVEVSKPLKPKNPLTEVQKPLKPKNLLAEVQKPLKPRKPRLAQNVHPLEKQKKKQVSPRKTSKSSVDEMTSNFLKTALMANKPIPEE